MHPDLLPEPDQRLLFARDSIITFFADTVVNALQADPGATASNGDDAAAGSMRDTGASTWAANGCTWTIRPVVCAMFLCDHAMNTVFSRCARSAKNGGLRMRRQEKKFKWPDRPVLFDHLEKVFHRSGLPFHAHAPEPESRIAAGQGAGGLEIKINALWAFLSVVTWIQG
jgi:hypothetical protein